MSDKSEHRERRRSAPFGIQAVSAWVFVLVCVFAVIGVVLAYRVVQSNARLEEAHNTYEECSQATNDLMAASDYLTTRTRLYVLTGTRSYLDDYLQEVQTTQRRKESLATLRQHIVDNQAYTALSNAYQDSSTLFNRELYAMRLVALATNLGNVPSRLQEVRVHKNDAALSNDQKIERAKEIVLSSAYDKIKESVEKNAHECTDSLMKSLQDQKAQISQALNAQLSGLRMTVYALLFLFALMWVINYLLMVRPMRKLTANIQNDEPLEDIGAQELRRVVESYNAMYRRNHEKTMHLLRVAQTDALTGLLNRGSYDKLLEECDTETVLVLIDVDLFKDVNDTYGHEMGDKVLKRVATSVAEHFRATDYACRIGGDEFAVIMTETANVTRATIQAKIDAIAHDLRYEENGMPAASLSVGAAFGRELQGNKSLYQAADEALYESKRNGRNRLSFHKAR
ncbi:MAG: diguanylate cyclase [Atopobiaceae bacterium]|nr:diguanylate cyclase [Atopobiaceae bacterium]